MTDLKISGYTVAQSPNPPLLAAILGLVASWLLSDGSTVHGLARAVFYVGLTIWAWQELADGVNGFRRILGALGLAYVVFAISRDLD